MDNRKEEYVIVCYDCKKNTKKYKFYPPKFQDCHCLPPGYWFYFYHRGHKVERLDLIEINQNKSLTQP